MEVENLRGGSFGEDDAFGGVVAEDDRPARGAVPRDDEHRFPGLGAEVGERLAGFPDREPGDVGAGAFRSRIRFFAEEARAGGAEFRPRLVGRPGPGRRRVVAESGDSDQARIGVVTERLADVVGRPPLRDRKPRGRERESGTDGKDGRARGRKEAGADLASSAGDEGPDERAREQESARRKENGGSEDAREGERQPRDGQERQRGGPREADAGKKDRNGVRAGRGRRWSGAVEGAVGDVARDGGGEEGGDVLAGGEAGADLGGGGGLCEVGDEVRGEAGVRGGVEAERAGVEAEAGPAEADEAARADELLRAVPAVQARERIGAEEEEEGALEEGSEEEEEGSEEGAEDGAEEVPPVPHAVKMAPQRKAKDNICALCFFISLLISHKGIALCVIN